MNTARKVSLESGLLFFTSAIAFQAVRLSQGLPRPVISTLSLPPVQNLGQVIVLLAVLSGTRIGELLALRRKYVDFLHSLSLCLMKGRKPWLELRMTFFSGC
jgi:integrase